MRNVGTWCGERKAGKVDMQHAEFEFVCKQAPKPRRLWWRLRKMSEVSRHIEDVVRVKIISKTGASPIE